MTEGWVNVYRNVFYLINTCNIFQPVLILHLLNKE